MDGSNAEVRTRSGFPSTWKISALWLVPVLFLSVFFFLPLAEITNRSGILTQGVILDHVTWGLLTKSLSFTITQATVSTALTLCIGIPGAYLLSHFRFMGRELLKAMLIVPFILPTVVVATCFNALLGPRGLINDWLMTIYNLQTPPIALLNTFWAIILGHVFYNTSIIILVMSEAWSKLNPNYQDSARILGANRLQTAFKVTLPLLAPSLLSSGLLVFIFDFTSFGVVLLLGGPLYATLEVEIYIQAIHMLNFPAATLLSLIQISMTLVMSVIYARISRGQTLELTPHFKAGRSLADAPVLQKCLGLGILTLLFLIFFSPLIALVIRSLTSYHNFASEGGSFGSGITLAYYAELLVNRRDDLFYVPPYSAIINSILFALITVAIALPLGILVVRALKMPQRINRILEPMLMLPLGTSAVTLGLGLVLTFNSTSFYQASFPLLLPIAHALVGLPLLIRVIQPVNESIPQNLIDSAYSLGADWWRVFRDVELPLLKKSVSVAAIFAFSVSLGEFGATTFLNRPEFPTIPIAIFRFLNQPGQINYGQAMAMSTILMILSILSILLIQITSYQGREGK
ncbi:MAG: iron ABC transporter permease [Anaerolineaceae bacterium]|nr:iron ABC transporter permease [Anaerolineaceae bacterium]